MKNPAVIACVVILTVTLSLNGCKSCYAGPFVYGPVCEANRGLIGITSTRITYTIEPINTVGTEICCEALGCAQGYEKRCGSWGYYSLGCSTSSLSAVLIWGANAGKPATRCKGIPSGTLYSLSWNTATTTTVQKNVYI
ncbi:uncharacterized protein LOC124440943 [Xenia sp. Carnegie-2017]|uniref:uncharacterized protein LOC124440943 n=1 Tax=Xenia sp. Carnegie-2017 TaxID=2897299 RepID=UPI001F03C337|nr:uncharacterized protein LOC124440943 [Xenia sp. Carnegie-2017]